MGKKLAVNTEVQSGWTRRCEILRMIYKHRSTIRMDKTMWNTENKL